MNKKKIFILMVILMVIATTIFFIFFYIKSAKNLKIGNNTSSQEIVNYILNISSYETTVKVEVESNKNKNRYVLKQEYKSPNIWYQEILEPSNIAGVKMIKEGNQLKIENTNLNLTTIFENYEYVSDNLLDLSVFIQDYQSYEKATWKEENNQIIMNTKNETQEKTLWVDRTTGKPIKLEVKCNNQKTQVYILYNEVNLNCLK